jgi:predicted O-linked N-acetylglucosamine transferase (SPINDLY family)
LSAEALLELATARHRAGDLAEARRLYGEVLASVPSLPLAAFRAGLLELQEGHAGAALALFDRSLAGAGGVDSAGVEPRFHFGRGQALQALRRWGEAASAFEAAVSGEPEFPDAWNDLGNCRQHLRDYEPAIAAYRRSLELRPAHAGTLANLGAALQAVGHIDAAVANLRAAVAADPPAAGPALNLGIALCRQRDFAAAAEVLGRLQERYPDLAEAAFNRGIALHGLGDAAGALRQFRLAGTLRPEYADAYINLGNVCRELGQFTAAEAAYTAALAAQPDSAVALNNAGCLLRTLGRIDEAEEVLRRGLALHPANAALHDSLGNVLKDAGDIDAAIACFRESLRLDPANAITHGNLAYSLSFQSSTAGPIVEECRRWDRHFALPLRASPAVHDNDRDPERRLRIGYVSPDFREHCQALFLHPLLAHHDHTQFEIRCYASVERPDEVTRRLRALADGWRDVRGCTDAALADLVRADGIDILVDLTMHMAGGRPLLFARKPAPVQIAWLAYPGTTGLGTMDYRLSDPRLDPPGAEAPRQPPYTERTLLLPDSFWCYNPLADGPAVNALPAPARGQITFGCLNNPCKLTGETLRLWGAVLSAVPGARLLLLAPPGRHRERLVQRLLGEGVARDRLSFVPFRRRSEYLRSYQDIDIGLDTFPYNGHTTSLDAFWMGVPVITRVGATCVGRGGIAQLFHLGLCNLAAGTDAAFVEAAAALAADLPRLGALRADLRGRLAASPLMDGARFARGIEGAYRSAWREYLLQSASKRPPGAEDLA